jgi:hypothetical protein
MHTKLLNTFLMISAFLLSTGAVFAVDRGLFASLSYAPQGAGYMFLARRNGANGTDSTKPYSGYEYDSATRMNVGLGYYYDFLQADLSYTKTDISSQSSDFLAPDDLQSGEASAYSLRFGKRFSTPGDTSYTWLYLGLKQYNFQSSAGSLDVTGYGYFVGYSGFYSFGLKYDMEFVLKGDAYFGSYRFEKFSSNIGFDNVSKRYSFTGGAGIGAGVQYEPYNITFLIKLSSEMDYLVYDALYAGSKKKFAVGGHAHCIGIELMYVLPSDKYNERN